jgi:hypothetical protein
VVASPSPTRSVHTRASTGASPTTAGASWPTQARTASDRCGRAPGPRTRPTPTCSTSSS